MALRAYKYRIYPNEIQKEQLAKTFGCTRFVYNHCLAKRIQLYEDEKKSLSKIDCNNYVNRELKAKYEWLKEVDKFGLTNAIYNMDTAYQKFFNERSGFPKYKSKRNNRHAYTTNFTNNNIEINHESNCIKLPKLKWVKAKIHRGFSGKIKQATISQVASKKYYVSVLVKDRIKPLPETENIIAFDLGIKDFLIDDQGTHIPNPKPLEKHLEKLAQLQRQLAHKKKGSNNWHKQRIKVAGQHEKIKQIRLDFLHKLTTQMIKENQLIISEDLAVKEMIKNKDLSRAIADVSWGELTRQLTYKAKWYNRTYHKVDRYFPSSQICSDCGTINNELKDYTIRKWNCKVCKKEHDRDENAAINIRQKGLEDLKINIA